MKAGAFTPTEAAAVAAAVYAGLVGMFVYGDLKISHLRPR